LDVKAAHSDVDAMRISLSAETAETWFSIIEQNALLALVQEQLKTNETYLKLVQLRFGQGLVSSLDVYQQQQQVAGTRAQIPLLESRLKVLRHKLAVLTGQPPQEDISHLRYDLPELPDIPAIGLPSELLTARPDIKAAQYRVSSADLRAGAAVADRFPSLKLSASGGFRATELSELFENLVWDILGNISATLWDGGRKNAEIKRTNAVLKERLAFYAQTALEAFQEVEDALVKEEYQRNYLKELEKQIKYSEKSLEEARSRYLNGLDDYLRVLTALTSLQNLEQNLIGAKKLLLSHRIQLCRALGGGWK
jgi:NodT family efflux transporter outer membrane factor (OMF) lipoprotein